MLVTCKAPDFTAPAIFHDNKIINDFNLKNYIKNKTAVLFFWPMDFTFVCPSEVIAFDKFLPEFSKRKTEIIGVSIDSIYVHHAWRQTSPKEGGIGLIKYTIVSDIKREIQKLYNVEHPKLGVALRASFLIDKKGIVRHQIINDLPFGRNISDIIRMIDALNFYETHGDVCPANWNIGKDGMKATTNGVKEYLKKTYTS
ncbi:peroxiredoxin [Buchnera aphidicola (Schlechtendalia chinensis)]|uniref:Thioredoxin peroxidase n=1 Tax=Buchnera aphidicola subsp. Schlechtendalia chinensis TaxID=118110 RepID=A0A172WDG8_BUCSC|nr:redoxin domain-containing protein [Buchnera aphidicola]ANF16975.1 peroxiredoxin [Buchnera aphidicola (Schlechtendalia chinensis)]